MKCPKCGSEVPENIKFCPICGSPMPESAGSPEPARQETSWQEPLYKDPAPISEAPSYQDVYQMPAPAGSGSDPSEAGASKSILIMGIIGIALSTMPFLVSIAGIIISAICRGKVKNYIARYGEVHGKAKVGAILSKIGLILSIIMTVCWAIIMISIGILFAEGTYYGWGDILEEIFDIY